MTALFKFETRACPTCGGKFEALAFWDADTLCGDCGTRQYRERLAALSEGRSYTLESLGGACPTQATGRLADGRPFYFRARHGQWLLHVGLHDDPTDYVYWAARGDDVVSGGDDHSGGYMDDEEVLVHIDRWVDL